MVSQNIAVGISTERTAGVLPGYAAAAWVGVAVYSAIVLLTGPSHADEGTDAAYRETIQQAVTEFRLGHWPEALVLFRKAHASEPSARTLRGMGISAFEARRYADSILWLSQSLEHPVRPLSPEMRREVEGVLKRAEQFVGSYAADFEPSGAQVTANGREPVRIGDQLKLDPGPQRLVIQANGFRKMSKTITVRGGERGTLRVRLQPEADAPPLASADAAQPTEPQPTAVGEKGRNRAPEHLVPWSLIAGGGALVVTGATLLGLTARDISTVENAKGTGAEIQATQERVPRRSAWGFGLTTVGLVSAGLGATWLTLDWSGKQGRDRVSLSPNWGGVRVSGTF